MSEEDFWAPLKNLTRARIALGRAGGSLPTKAWLSFRLAHSKARDAVYRDLDFDFVESVLFTAGIKIITVSSLTSGHQDFLRRPDRGRALSEESHSKLCSLAIRGQEVAKSDGKVKLRIALVLSAGLSATAAMSNGPALVVALVPEFLKMGLDVLPVSIVRFGRVGLGDCIGEALKADVAVVLVGERPGLDTAESLGVYITYRPGPNSSDADRNCVSNIHNNGLSIAAAVHKISWLVASAINLRKSGVALKEDSSGQVPLIR